MRHIMTASGEIVYDYQGQLHITSSIKKVQLIEVLEILETQTYFEYDVDGTHYKTLMSRVGVITKHLKDDMDDLFSYLDRYQMYMVRKANLESEINSL